jgi:WD40 repeat protein
VTGGDDGQVCATAPDGTTRVVARDGKRRWIDQVALGDDLLAWSAGKQVFVQAQGEPRALDLPSSARGLAFGPDGVLAIAHYNGVTLWHAREGAINLLEWKGLHLNVKFSPDGRFLVSTMQEPAIHGWHLADKTSFPVPLYPERVRSIDWSFSGRWLATSGSERLVLIPFDMANPMSRMPLLLAPYQVRVAAVACHPARDVVAVGYADGLTLLVRVPDGAEILLKNPASSISALAWSGNGDQLAIACADGTGRVLDLS